MPFWIVPYITYMSLTVRLYDCVYGSCYAAKTLAIFYIGLFLLS